MARKSFLARIADRVRKFFSGPSQPVQQEEPPTIPQPPIGGGPPITGDDLELDYNRREIWYDVTGIPDEFSDINQYWEIFVDSGAPIDVSYGRVNRLWRNFLRAFYLTLDEANGYTRDDWYEDADTVPALIDWQRWREVKRGTP